MFLTKVGYETLPKYMWVKFSPVDLNSNPCPHCPQALILVKWPSHQEYNVIKHNLSNSLYMRVLLIDGNALVFVSNWMGNSIKWKYIEQNLVTNNCSLRVQPYLISFY